MTWIEQSTRNNLLITTYLFTQQIVLELGLLNYFDAWSLEPTPFFSKLQMMALIGKVWTMTFHMLFPFRFSAARAIILLVFSFAPSKEYMSQLFPQKKMSRFASLQKIAAFAVNSVGVGVPSPSNHRDRDDWVLWRVGPVSHDLPPERRLQPQRGESFMEGERTIVKGSAASWGIKMKKTLIFRRGWSMMLDSIFHTQRGSLGGKSVFPTAKLHHFRSDQWLPRILDFFRSKPCDRFIRSTVKVMPWWLGASEEVIGRCGWKPRWGLISLDAAAAKMLSLRKKRGCFFVLLHFMVWYDCIYPS